MLHRFIPREEKFFTLFRESAEQIVKGAVEFEHMLKDLSHSERHARHIKDIEHMADSITHRTIELLHKTFITPLDREDIHQLISKMDDILDFIEAASGRVHLYGVKQEQITPEIKTLAEICVESARLIQLSVAELENIKKPKEIVRLCIEINRLENEADHELRKGMAKLFKEETDVRELIKLKEIYELMETVTDRCEDVANIIEGIVLEYA